MIISLFKKNPFIRKRLARLYHYMLSRGRYAGKIGIVTLEVSSACNLRCPMCGVPKLKRGKGFMTLGDFKTIAAKLPAGLRLLKLTYAGEPLLNRDIFAMIRHYRGVNKSAHIRVSTNGTNLHAFDPKDILASGVSQIDVAIEGASALTHESYRRGSDFKTVCGNVKKLCEVKKLMGLNSPKIVMMTLLSRKSLAELDGVKKLAVKLGVDELHLRYMVIPGLGKNASDLDNSIYGYLDQEQRERWIDEYAVEEPYGLYRAIGKAGGLSPLSNDAGKYGIIDEMRHCSSFLTPMIFYNGDVSVCCLDGEGDYVFGNLVREDFKTVAARIPAKEIYGRKLPLCGSCVLSWKGMNYAEIKINREK